MKTAIILHGMPDKEEYFNPTTASQSNRHWLPWIQKQLILKGVLAQALEMPEPYAPDYKKFCAVFELFPITEDTMLIGHSCGGGFLLRWLSQNKIKVGKVALVAPWLDPDREHTTDFFDFELDPALTERTQGIHLFNSNDDYPEIQTSVKKITDAIPGIQLHELTNRGHFTGEKNKELPELRDALLS